MFPLEVLANNPLQPAVGGADAGYQLYNYYPHAEEIFPILPDGFYVNPDTRAGTFGLAWYLGQTTDGLPIFAIRDDVIVDEHIAFHEATHALEDVLNRIVDRDQAKFGTFGRDFVMTHYWSYRGFPGTWMEAQQFANTGGGWPYYPSESFAEFGSAAISGVWIAEWTQNYGKSGFVNAANIYDPVGQAVRARAFLSNLINEIAGGDLVADAEVMAVLRQIERNTRETFDVMNAFSKITFPTLTDRLGDDRDVATGGPDKTVSQP